MAKSCVACGKSIGMLGVRIPLLESEDVVICADCFSKMPPVLNDLYQKKINPYKDELIELKEDIIQNLRLQSFNTDTINIVTKYMDWKISRTSEKVQDDKAIVQKICPICRNRVSYEIKECFSCGYIFKEEVILSKKQIAEIYNGRLEQYKRNAYYEYDYIVVENNMDGYTDKDKIAKIIREHAFQGWRLISMYSNEIGKNALSVGGIGANATMSEDILVFERCIKGEE